MLSWLRDATERHAYTRENTQRQKEKEELRVQPSYASQNLNHASHH